MMQSIFLPLLGILGGVFLAVQAPVNANLSVRLGHPVLAAAVSFTTGMIALYAIIIALGLRPQAGATFKSVPVYLWFAGGLLGIAYMVVSVFLIPRIGTAAVIGTTVTGQLLTALAVDRFGLLGLPMRDITLSRGLGALLLLAGVILIVRR